MSSSPHSPDCGFVKDPTKTTDCTCGQGGSQSLAPLTPEQVLNWRRVMLGVVGPYAMLMPVEDIEAYRRRMQEIADGLEGEGDEG